MFLLFERVAYSDLMNKFMNAAIAEARKGLIEHGIHIGSVLVKNNRIIGRGHNQRVQKHDPILHAEIDCLENAGRLKSYRGCTLYSTLMPCYLCAGAIVQFGIKKIVCGENRSFAGAEKFLHHHGVSVKNIDSSECIGLMTEFIRKNPKLWKEDIGKL